MGCYYFHIEVGMNKQLNNIDNIGNTLVGIFHRIALFGIGAATVWAAGTNFLEMFGQSRANINDLLLLFIYLEIGAMVGIYFKTNHMPVRFLIYIAITALTRHMVDLVAIGDESMTNILTLALATLILSISLVLVRMASSKYPSNQHEDVG
jgi:phosphate starvation-inducible membrane PsiE